MSGSLTFGFLVAGQPLSGGWAGPVGTNTPHAELQECRRPQVGGLIAWHTEMVACTLRVLLWALF